MSNFSENFGLSFLFEDEEGPEPFIRYILNTGKTIPNYYGYPYIFKSVGKPEYFARIKPGYEGRYELCGLDSHCCGNCVWDMVHSGIDLSPKDSLGLNRVALLRNLKGDGMVPIELITADVYPSFLKGDRFKIQVIGLPFNVSYYPDEEAYSNALPKDREGQTWGVANGALIPVNFLYNHAPGRKGDVDPDSDKIVMFMATVKRINWGYVNITGEGMKTFIRVFVDTLFGELEFDHTLDQVDEDQRDFIKEGAIISGECILSGDLAIDEYDEGIIKDHEHDLRLLRYTFVRGEEERLRTVLREDASYESDSINKEYYGKDSILQHVRTVLDTMNCELVTAMATITTAEEGMEYQKGTRCFVLAYGKDEDYEAIVFIDVDDDGLIKRIKISTDGRYRFCVDDISSPASILEDVKMPGTVEDTIFLRAKAFGIRPWDETLEQFQSESERIDKYHERTERLLERTKYYMLTGPGEKMEILFCNLFERAFAERLLSEINVSIPEPEPEAMFSDDFYVPLNIEWEPLIEESREYAKGFCRDYDHYCLMSGTKETSLKLFADAAVIVQELGEAYAVKHKEDAVIEYVESDLPMIAADEVELGCGEAFHTDLPLESFKEKSDFIEAVSDEVVSILNDGGKEAVLESEKWEMHSFGLGLYIRNMYIHGRKLAFDFSDPDDLSAEITDRIIEKLWAEKATEEVSGQTPDEE